MKKKAPITMLLAGGTLVTLIVSTNSLPGAKAGTSTVKIDPASQVQLAILDSASPAPAVAAPAPMSSTFAALLAEPWAQPAGSTTSPAVGSKAKPGAPTNTTAMKGGVPSAVGTIKPDAPKAATPLAPFAGAPVAAAPRAIAPAAVVAAPAGDSKELPVIKDPAPAPAEQPAQTTPTTAAPALVVVTTTAPPPAPTTTTTFPATTTTTAPPVTTTTTPPQPTTTTTTKPPTKECTDARTTLAKDQATLDRDLAAGAKADVIKRDRDRVAADQANVTKRCA